MEKNLEDEQLLPARWGQDRRLEFIEFRLQWEGRVNRSDLVNHFSISLPQASLDLARYREIAPANTSYDVVQKTYIASPSFTPVISKESADDYLVRLWAAVTKTVDTSASFLGWTPPVDIVRDPARSVDAGILRSFLLALREKRMVRIDYQSMTTDEPSKRAVSPHAFAFDGFRWHIRAFCHTRNGFRDFAIGRIRTATAGEITAVDPKADLDWQNFAEAVIVPHPTLSPAQRRAVELDYCMKNGRLVLRVREALLFYHLEHLGLLESPENSKKHIALENSTDLREFFEKHSISI
jgi:hypothetical protein